MNLEPISNRQKREAGVLHGACRSCREFFGSAETRAVIKLGSYESVTYVRACRDLEISKEAGCVLCKTFVEIDAVRGVEGFREWLRKGDSNYRLDEREYEICNYTGQSFLDDGYVVRGQWGEWDYTLEYTMQLLITTSADDPASTIYSYRPANRDVGSSRAFQWIAGQLDDCMTKHKHTQRTYKPKPWKSPESSLPTRLMEIVNDDTFPTVRLAVTAGQVGSYLALSYCWGGAQEHATTTTNVKEYLQEIPRFSIPDTISDAVHVTKSLGFKYLWVDSYCILQNHEADVMTELAKMSSIYQNAAITICAASARSCEDGFLGERIKTTQRARETRCTIPLKDRYGQPAGSFHLDVVLHRAAKEHLALDNEPLNKRAWALQEIALSPRKLYYGEERLTWSCEHGETPDGGRWTYADQGIWLSMPPLSSQDNKTMLKAWFKAVEMFSKRALTAADDKFPAVSAIAAEVQHRTNWTYAAGLWQEAMLHCLGWSRARDTDPSARHIAQWRAPSWSWASLDEAVKYVKTLAVELSLPTEVIDSSIMVLHEKNPLGQIQQAQITIRGPLSPVIFHDGGRISIADTAFRADFERTTENSKGTWTIDREMPMYDLHPAALHRKFSKSKKKRLSGFLRSGRRDMAAGEDCSGCIAWCLALWVAFIGGKDVPEDDYATVGLVLMKASEDRYQRVGLFLGPHCETYGPHDCAFKMAPVTTVTII